MQDPYVNAGEITKKQRENDESAKPKKDKKKRNIG
jgi:hypothetical protein